MSAANDVGSTSQQPYLELARDVVAKIEGVEQDSSGDLRMACPLENHTTFIVPAANQYGDAIWCDRECDPRQVEAALRWLVGQLPNLCTDPRRDEFGHRDTCPRCLTYAPAARRAYSQAREQFLRAGSPLEIETEREFRRLQARKQAEQRLAVAEAEEFARLTSGVASPDEVESVTARFRTLTADDIRHARIEPDMVDGLLGPPGTLNQINGHRGSMKTLMTLGLVAAVAGGMSDVYGLPVHGHGPVLYAYLEGANGLGRRLRAWEFHHDRQMSRVTFLHDPIDIKRPEDVRALAVLARQIGARVIVLDSVAKTGGGREDVEDFGNYRLGLESLRDATGAAVLVLHNTGHDRSRGRGHTTLVDGMDSAVLLTPRSARDGGGVVLSDEKSRDSAPVEGIRLRFEPAGDIDPRTGRPWSGVVVRQDVMDTATQMLAARNELADVVLAVIDDAGAEGATPRAIADALGLEGTGNLTKELRPLLEARIIEDNGKGTRARRYQRAAAD